MAVNFQSTATAEYFQTGGRHVPELRARKPEPVLFVSPNTSKQQQITESEWVKVETRTGTVDIQVGVRANMPDDLVRIPHGWWKPETERGLGKLSGVMQYADAQLCPDDGDYLDREQGIPHLKGLPCRIVKSAGASR